MFLATLFLVPPEHLIVVPLLLGCAGGLAWFAALGRIRSTGAVALVGCAGLAIAAHLWLPEALGLHRLSVSDYKGVSYARKFPDSHRVYRSYSPFGDLEVYGSSYLHFAPGLSDNAAFNLPTMPANA